MGLFGFAIPEEYGGLGLTMEQECRLVFELGCTTPAFRSMFGTNNGIAGHVLMEGRHRRSRSSGGCRGMATGEVIASFALTEPEAGSDPAALRTTAAPRRRRLVINGAKRYITNAPIADVFMVFARTDRERRGAGASPPSSCRRGTPGLTVGPKDHKMGQFGAWTADVYLDDVRVPARRWSAARGRGLHGRRCAGSPMAGCTSRRSVWAWPSGC